MILLNGNVFNITMFSDQTSQVWKLPEQILTQTNFAHVTWKFAHEGEFMHLAQLKALLDKHGLTSALRLPYLPYGRQDKEVSNTSTFALNTFANLLNTLKFQEVIINDPHSSVALELINNSRAAYPIGKVKSIIEITESDMLCFPDKGALTKYAPMYYLAQIHGEKVRDQLTGNITSYKLIGDPKDRNVLIVDDICDAGGTFKILAKDLLAAGANSVVLFVTHGIFSKGLQILKDSGIQRIFSQDGEAREEAGQIIYRRL